jgi:CheY-like chemotaxis protein
MSAEVLAHAVEPFFTTKPIGVGTGLGLSICHGIVQSLGGELSIESEVGRGTTVRVALAAWVGRTSRPAPSRREPASAAPRARILVVDDEMAIGEVIRRSLRKEGDVTAVTDGRTALALIDAGETFDVILCDLMMPDLSGMDLHREIARRAPSQASRMLFMTGGTFTERAQRFLDESKNTRLYKPFSPKQLREAVGAILLGSST